jgi:hypothetical protein
LGGREGGTAVSGGGGGGGDTVHRVSVEILGGVRVGALMF